MFQFIFRRSYNSLLNVILRRSLLKIVSFQDCRRSVSLPSLSPVENSRSNVLLFVTIHPRKGRLFIVLRKDQRPQYLVHNRLKSHLFFAEDYGIEGHFQSLNLIIFEDCRNVIFDGFFRISFKVFTVFYDKFITQSLCSAKTKFLRK